MAHSLTSNDVSTRRYRLDRLTFFCALWSITALNHYVMLYPPASARFGSLKLWWPIIGVAILSTLCPRSLFLFSALLVASLVHSVDKLPRVPDHFLFESFVGLALLSIFAAELWRGARSGENLVRSYFVGNGDPERREALYERFAPILRISTLLLYLISAVHKTNWDYFDPDVSCGATLLSRLAEQWPSVRIERWAKLSSIWGTLSLEYAIPVMLLFRRTRTAGVLIALLFHLTLGLLPMPGVRSFSSTMIAMLFLFMPANFVETFHQLCLRCVPGARVWATGRLRISYVVLVLAVAGHWALIMYISDLTALLDFGMSEWYVWAAIYVASSWGVILASARKPMAFDRAFLRPASIGQCVLPAVVLFNGLNPYLGLKTENAFSMFSNLRTEGGRSNHLFLGDWMKVFDLQDDLVEIVEVKRWQTPFVPRPGNERDERKAEASKFNPFRKLKFRSRIDIYKEQQQLIPYFEFRRICAENPRGNIRVTYRHRGATKRFELRNGRANDPELVTPSHWLLRKFLCFRPVDSGPKMRCRV